MKHLLPIALLFSPAVSPAQNVEPAADVPIRVEVNVVNVPVTVADKEGRFVVDLTKDDFRVYEDGRRVQIRYLTGSTDKNMPPLRIGFLVDMSNAARLYYKTYKNSIGDLAFSLIPEDGAHKGFLLGYHSEVDELVKMTNDAYLIAEKLERLKHGGGSTLLDAVYQACTKQLAEAQYSGPGEPRRAIIVIGDGHDNASRFSLSEVVHIAQRAQVTVYGISTIAWGFHQEGEDNLQRLVQETGGVLVHPMEQVHKGVSGYLSKPQDAGNFVYTVGTGEYNQAQLQALHKAITDITGTVQSQYLLGYVPTRPFTDGKFRSIRVEVKLEHAVDVTVRHRTGYFPPAANP